MCVGEDTATQSISDMKNQMQLCHRADQHHLLTEILTTCHMLM